jgi:hypothetical protein
VEEAAEAVPPLSNHLKEPAVMQVVVDQELVAVVLILTIVPTTWLGG